MKVEELLEEVLKLEPDDRLSLVDGILRSIGQPDALHDIWHEEAQRRLHAYRAGKLTGIPMETLFSN